MKHVQQMSSGRFAMPWQGHSSKGNSKLTPQDTQHLYKAVVLDMLP